VVFECWELLAITFLAAYQIASSSGGRLLKPSLHIELAIAYRVRDMVLEVSIFYIIRIKLICNNSN
jgi:hypothetical protein